MMRTEIRYDFHDFNILNGENNFIFFLFLGVKTSCAIFVSTPLDSRLYM